MRNEIAPAALWLAFRGLRGTTIERVMLVGWLVATCTLFAGILLLTWQHLP